MSRLENPLTVLSDCIAHAQYEGFSKIAFYKHDWVPYSEAKVEDPGILPYRPNTYNFEVFAMFSQEWGSTALGFSGIGGAAMTDAYTVVLFCEVTGEYLVYFDGCHCYTVTKDSKNIDLFFEDIKNRCLVQQTQVDRYNG